jgi:hypothetical protein
VSASWYLTICCSHRKSEKMFHLPRRNSWVHWFWCKRAFNWFTMEPNATTADSSGRFKSIWYCLHEILLFFLIIFSYCNVLILKINIKIKKIILIYSITKFFLKKTAVGMIKYAAETNYLLLLLCFFHAIACSNYYTDFM